MNPLVEFVQRGGPAVIAIMLLSVALYARCCTVLLGLRRSCVLPGAGASPPLVRRQQGELRDAFRQDRITLGAMIAAAPLLGLLGTVSGMVTTFESLSDRTAQKSMEGLAGGIAEVLVATESGLAVALPAMLLVYVAHRQLTKRLLELNQLERNLQNGGAS